MEVRGGYGVPAPVSSSYCLPHEAELIVKRKLFSLSQRYTVKDVEGTLLFDVRLEDVCWDKTRTLCDGSGRPVLLLKRKFWSLHSKWAVYRGDNESGANILFIIQKSSVLQCTPAFNVVLSTTVNSSTPDFTVKGNFSRSLYTAFHNGTPIAQSKRICFSTKRVVTVFPGVDRAFISAVFIVLDIERRRKQLGQQQALAAA